MSAVFLKRGSGALYPPRIVCFVCANQGPADYPLFAEPPAHANPLTAPHFPFLLSHSPPMGCLPVAQTGGEAKACRHCYTTLMRQWEEYERARIPTTRRAYWIKRADDVPFQTPEQQHQMAERLLVRLGLPLHQYPLVAAATAANNAAAAAVVPVTTAAAAGLMLAPLPPASVVPPAPTAATPGGGGGVEASKPPVAAHVWSSRESRRAAAAASAAQNRGGDEVVVLTTTPSAPTGTSAATSAASSAPAGTSAAAATTTTGGSGAPVNDNDSALDLSSGSSRERDNMKSRSSAASHISAVSHHSSYQSEGAGSSTDILDLTLPDKNSAHEVCYVCGEDFKRGTLSHSLAKQLNREEPFYPSLMRHSRPPRSQPMDASGRVQTCDECHNHLLQQWYRFEEDDIPHTDRDYLVREYFQFETIVSLIVLRGKMTGGRFVLRRNLAAVCNGRKFRCPIHYEFFIPLPSFLLLCKGICSKCDLFRSAPQAPRSRLRQHHLLLLHLRA